MRQITIRRRFVITETAEGFSLVEETPDSVWPTTEKATARELVARLSQLLNIGPVAPQTWPEIVGISAVESRTDEDEN